MKRTISLFLVASVLLLSIPLTAKERKGADLIVQKTDGTHARGELIAVKENSLLLLERESGADVTIDVWDIDTIKIKKNSKTVLGIGIGLVIGGAAGTLAGYEGSKVFWAFDERKTWAWIGGIIGMVSGALIGKMLSKPGAIQIEGKPDTEIQEIMEKLRNKARIRNSR